MKARRTLPGREEEEEERWKREGMRGGEIIGDGVRTISFCVSTEKCPELMCAVASFLHITSSLHTHSATISNPDTSQQKLQSQVCRYSSHDPFFLLFFIFSSLLTLILFPPFYSYCFLTIFLDISILT
jgi:hypothetical protein